METVNSSNISAVGYDSQCDIMHVKFNNGSVYAYFNVPENIFYDLVHANSPGSYHHSFVKYRYKYARIV